MSRYSTRQIGVVQSYMDGADAENSAQLKSLLQFKSVEDRLHLLLNVKSWKYPSWTLLHEASRVNDLDNVKYMLKGFTTGQIYAAVKLQTGQGSTAVHFAACNGYAEVLNYLLNHLTQQQRLDVLKLQDEYGDTALHDAAKGKKTSTFRFILSSVSADQQRKLLNLKNKKTQSVYDVAEPELLTDCPRQALGEIDQHAEELERNKRENAEGGTKGRGKSLEDILAEQESEPRQVKAGFVKPEKHELEKHHGWSEYKEQPKALKDRETSEQKLSMTRAEGLQITKIRQSFGWDDQDHLGLKDILSQEGEKLLDLKRELKQKDAELKEQKQIQIQYTVRLTEFEERTSQLTHALEEAKEALETGRLHTENWVEKSKKLQREKIQQAEALKETNKLVMDSSKQISELQLQKKQLVQALEEANKVAADGRKRIEQLVKKIEELEKDKYQSSLGFTEMISDMGEQKRMMEREANQRAEELTEDPPVGDVEQAEQVLVESDTQSAAIQLNVQHRALMDSKDEDSTRLTAQSNLKQHNGDVVTDGNEPDSAVESYVVIPAQLTEKIKKMCHDLAFDDCQIIQDPYIWQDVLVVAVEATSKLSGPLNDLLKTDKEFEKFKIKPFDYEGDSESEQLGDWQCTFTLDRKTVATGSAICELVVQTATEPQRVFAVGPAHVMFCNEANEKFRSDECKIEEIRKEIESTSPKRIITMKSAHGFDEMVVHQIPWIGYRYQYKQQPPVTKQHKLYTNDCVLFQFDLSIANQVQKELSDAKLTRHEKLREVETTSSLQTDHSLRQRIAVQGFTGLLFHCVSIDEQIEQRKGLHLTFVLTSKDEEGKCRTLSPGDSGSIVYFIGEKQDGKERHQPWGMLVQRFRITGLPYFAYRAVVLNQVFRDMEDDYKLRPGEIKLFSSPEQGAATINDSPHCATKAGPMPPCLARLKVEQPSSPGPVPSHSHLSTG